ncbi:MAG: MFS transporter [Catenulispora sp.]
MSAAAPGPKQPEQPPNPESSGRRGNPEPGGRLGLGRQFKLLWAGQSVSYIGDKVNVFVVPAVMILLLHASAFQVGLVAMAQYLAIPLLSLVAGMLVDRWDLRLTLVACDLIRFTVILLVMVAYWSGHLSVALLFFSVAIVNAASVFFTIGYTATIANVVPAEGRVAAYSNMETSRTAAEVVGPAVASFLYQVMGIAALLVDAGSYLFSAGAIRSMRGYGERKKIEQSMGERLKAGVRLNWTDPVLRGTLIGTFIMNVGGPVYVTVMPILAYRGLHLSVGTYGLAMSVAAAAALAGALVAQRVSKLIGAARLMPMAVFAHSAVGLGILLAPTLPSAIVVGAVLSCYGVTMVWYNVCTAAVRQVRIPVADQAVSAAAFRTLTWGIIPVSALLAGVFVQMLTPGHGVLNACKITMACATLIGTLFAWPPEAGIQRKLDREKALAGAASAASPAAPVGSTA